MTTATMEMLTTATTTTPATGNSSSIASTTVTSGGSGSGVAFSSGASLEEMMRSTMPVDYSNLSGVVPLLEEVDGNVTTVSQHSNDSIERTVLPGSSSQPHGHVHHKGHSRGSSAPQAYDRITTKIACTKELIRKEQEARDANVNEYLRLAANADKQQLQRLKAVADNINQLTSTWYTGSAADSDLSGIDVASGTEGQQTTPNASGPGGGGGGGQSNQHNTSISDSEGRRTHGTTQGQGQQHHHHQQQLHGVSSGHRHHGAGPGGKYSEHDSECSSVTSDSIPLGSDKHRLSCSQRCVNYKALNELREQYQKLKERLDRVEQVQKDVSELSMALENERYRADRLEEQINDLSELHQNERENLKQAIADLEEKVQYQSDERLRDVNEILENCQTRISKMEQLSQQQYVTVEGIYNSNARAVVVKLINVVLTVLQVILLLVATVAGIIVPFLKTRLRVLTTLFCTLVLIAIVRQWPDVRDTGVHLIRILRSQVVSETVT
uniref:Transmembrane and coiled-coil domains protein 1 n=1 Tax=Anopheles minimus TaxID=112268 RepID=A0A182W3H1_9DIPT